MSGRRFAVWIALSSCLAFVLTTPLSGTEPSRSESRRSTTSRSIVVTTTTELLAALAANAGETIFLQRGTYQLDHAIEVPDHTELIGEGEMLFDDSGLPTGFVPETRTVIAAVAGATGAFVTLGNRASLRGLIIQDLVRPALTGGGVLGVSSRAAGDSISAQVLECEIVNPNPAGNALEGPSGRGLVVMTRNPHFSTGAAPHDRSLVSVVMSHSIVRSPGGGGGVFVNNLASESHAELHLRQNVIGGASGANGASSRPDSVIGSSTVVQSYGNLYRQDLAATATSLAWNFQAGADGPAFGATAGATLNNSLWVHSVDDRIEGWGRTMIAAAGQRNNALSAAISYNQLDLILQGTTLRSITADLLFRGGLSLAAGVPTGDFNELRVTMRNVTGSGTRANDYVNSTANLGVGNQLLIVGSLDAFNRTNEGILPAPGAQFFTAGR